jgi:hypothetical protein
VAPRKISSQDGDQALRAWKEGQGSLDSIATAVRYSLQLFKSQAPGSAVEVRVPPFGAIQVIEGPSHTRGTPPAVVEMDADVWLGLATGTQTFTEALKEGKVRASGERSDLSAWLPIVSLP